MKQYLMSKIANKIIRQNLKMKESEDLLIVTEASKENIAESLASAALAQGVEPVIMYMTPRESDSGEPPHVVAEAMKAADAFLSVVEISITHSDAVKQALEAGSRGLVLTQFSEDMMYKGGMEADFEELKPVCIAVAKALEEANEIRVTSPFGTDLTFRSDGRRGNALYCIVEKGEFSTAPTVEANTTAIEGSA
ncbi:MAG: leucyl aminopeptidase, partial [Clostridiaceae bacterium]|nr:leucyl aminopeptidase [Clostridiaceae bacterium]